MTTTPTDGGPAFPQAGPELYRVEEDDTVTVLHTGISRLDYFAAKAMQGLLASGEHDVANDVLYRDAYHAAAAMLAESKRRGA